MHTIQVLIANLGGELLSYGTKTKATPIYKGYMSAGELLFPPRVLKIICSDEKQQILRQILA